MKNSEDYLLLKGSKASIQLLYEVETNLNDRLVEKGFVTKDFINLVNFGSMSIFIKVETTMGSHQIRIYGGNKHDETSEVLLGGVWYTRSLSWKKLINIIVCSAKDNSCKGLTVTIPIPASTYTILELQLQKYNGKVKSMIKWGKGHCTLSKGEAVDIIRKMIRGSLV